MNDDIKLKKAISEGKQAEDWLNHPVYKSVLVEIRAELFEAFEKSKVGTKGIEYREEVYRMNKALNLIIQKLERKVRDGNSANKTLLERIKNQFKRPA